MMLAKYFSLELEAKNIDRIFNQRCASVKRSFDLLYAHLLHFFQAL